MWTWRGGAKLVGASTTRAQQSWVLMLQFVVGSRARSSSAGPVRLSALHPAKTTVKRDRARSRRFMCVSSFGLAPPRPLVPAADGKYTARVWLDAVNIPLTRR